MRRYFCLLIVKKENTADENFVTHISFKANAVWLNNFLKRYNIYIYSCKNYIVEAGLVDQLAAEKYQQKLIDLIKDYTRDDIYNADETALMYRATSIYTFEYKETSANNIKIQKERLSIMFCANIQIKKKTNSSFSWKFQINNRSFQT